MSKTLNKQVSLSSRGGFTLIEVVLVLAIGGLIFLLAFLAYGQASRNQRNTQRRADAANILSEMQNYYNDNSQYPANSSGVTDLCIGSPANATFHSFIKAYVCDSDGFQTPDRVNYASLVPGVRQPTPDPAFAASTEKKNKIVYRNGANCNGDVTTGFRVEISLEGGSVVCRDDRN